MCKPFYTKIFKTCVLFLTFFGIGLNVSVLGPTLLDLQGMLNMVDHHGYIFSSRVASMSLGSIIGGVMMDCFSKKQLTLSMFGLALSISNLIIPWCHSLEVLVVLMIINGTALGCLTSGGNICCISLWGQNHAPFLQILNFALGLGTLVSPIIAAPFLSPFLLKEEVTLKSNETLQTSVHYNESELIKSYYSSDKSILYIYSILGAYTLFVTILIFIAIAISPKENFNQQKQKQVQHLKFGLVCLFVGLSFMVNFFGMGISVGIAQIFTTYLVEGSHHLSKAIGSYMTSVFWASFTISSGLSSILAKKIQPILLAIVNVGIAFIASILLLIFGMCDEWSLWVGCSLMGFGAGPIFPYSLSWTNKFAVRNSGKISGLLLLASVLGGILSVELVLHLMENVPAITFYVLFSSLCVALMSLFGLHLLSKKMK